MRSSMSTMSLAESRGALGASANSLTSVATKSGRASPSMSGKSSVSLRSAAADSIYEKEIKGKLKKASSRSSLKSVLESK